MNGIAPNQKPMVSPGWTNGGFVARVKGLLICGVLFSSLVGINFLQVMSLLLWPFSRQAFRAVNRRCAGTWWSWCVATSRKVYGVELKRTGDELPVGENALIVVNHQQMPDIVALMILARDKDRIGDLKWFVKDPIKYVPGVGWGMKFLDCVFLRRNWDSDRAHIDSTFSKLIQHRVPLWLISFSEGTRFTAAKLRRSQEYSAKIGIRPFAHVLVPRTKGLVATIQGLREHLDAVYDVTIGYESGLPSLWQYTCGWARRIHLNLRRVPIVEMPANPEALSQWLMAAFERKDALLETLSRTGAFSGEARLAYAESRPSPASGWPRLNDRLNGET